MLHISKTSCFCMHGHGNVNTRVHGKRGLPIDVRCSRPALLLDIPDNKSNELIKIRDIKIKISIEL